MKRKKLLIACSLIAGVIILGAIVTGWMVYSFFTKSIFGFKTVIPAELREPRIILGQDFLARETFLKADQTGTVVGLLRNIGTVDDLAVGELDGKPGLDVVIAGEYGAVIADDTGNKQSLTTYEFEAEKRKIWNFEIPVPHWAVGDFKIIDIEGDHLSEYLARGSIDGAALFAHNGKLIWSIGRTTNEKTSIKDLATGDLNGDGIVEFIVCWDNEDKDENKDSIELFDRAGNQKWSKPLRYEYFQAEVVDVNGDGKNEIIHGDSDMLIRGPQGDVLKTVKMPIYFSNFALCNALGTGKPQILDLQNGAVWLIDFEGKVVARFDAPLSKISVTPTKDDPMTWVGQISAYKAEGTWVKFSDGGPEYLAIVANFVAIDRSLIYVYSAKGQLVYHEIVPAECNAIAVLPEVEGKSAQALLIGCGQNVWRYYPVR